MKSHTANALWVASCRPGWQRFDRAAERVQETQAALLARNLNVNKASEYGQRHQFGSLASSAEYQARVPLTTYDDYTGYITRIGEGGSAVLTADPVRMLELSSGSTAASKLIPYTASLKAEFQRGLAPWIYNLYMHMPDLQRGPAYWSITPLTDGRRLTPGGLPIGFESDSAYLGLLGRWLTESVMAVPNAVKDFASVNNFRYATLLYLLRQPELRLISVWNPTFLSLLLAPLPAWWDSLLDDIHNGTLTLPEPGQAAGLRFAPHPGLARALRALSPAEPESLWPHLQLISCWMDGPSAPYALQLREKFPRVALQAKGLLATEAFVSFPLLGVEGSVLAIHSHFFEFISMQDGEPRLAHQLEPGQAYSVVVTTGGGFYRYQLHDIVEVIGRWKQVPCIRFVGKADHISDWFGEKLDERFVAHALEKAFAAHAISPSFAMLAPDDTDGFRYKLYIESDSVATHTLLAKDLDDLLCENFHYAYCRKLGQIGPVQVLQVRNGVETYLHTCQSRGQKLGNIKPSILQKNAGWEEAFMAKEV